MTWQDKNNSSPSRNGPAGEFSLTSRPSASKIWGAEGWTEIKHRGQSKQLRYYHLILNSELAISCYKFGRWVFSQKVGRTCKVCGVRLSYSFFSLYYRYIDSFKKYFKQLMTRNGFIQLLLRTCCSTLFLLLAHSPKFRKL